MTTFRDKLLATIEEMCGENTEYIIRDYHVNQELNWIDKTMSEYPDHEARIWESAIESVNNAIERSLTPNTVKVGDGVTVCLYSDRHAGTVIKKTKCSITIQYDKATIDPNFKPEFVIGGFAGHCTNQDDQTYTYERNQEGAIETYRWSKKYMRYQSGGDGSIHIIKGRHEFYDYNF